MDENGTDVILDEISGDEIQSVLDTLMGNSSISFMDYVASIIQGKVPFDPADMGRQLIQSVFGNIGQQRVCCCMYCSWRSLEQLLRIFPS